MEMMDGRACSEAEIQKTCLELGIKKFRSEQVFQWIQQHGVSKWEEMSNIGLADRSKLKQTFLLEPFQLIREQRSKDGTRKYLFGLGDGERIETVLMNYENPQARERHTICVSTQVGCAIGCSFCATGMGGFRRNLSVGEITGQVLEVFRMLRHEDPSFSVTNLVFMGMGEPFLNYDALIKAIQILNSPNGQNIGQRKMTISTSGIVPKILALAKDCPQVGLAISLHSARNEARDQLIPINRKYPIEPLIQACREYTMLTHRRITFEVALHHQNTNQAEADAMVRLLRGLLCHVNLIPINPVEGSNLRRPIKDEMMRYKKRLEAGNIPVSIREEKGSDIEAACGQLRQRMESGNDESSDQG